jgi:hypothetical protein
MRINPLNFYGRRVDKLMPHFTTHVRFLTDYQEERINRWIHENCSGRYCLVKSVRWDRDAWRSVTTIGFEEPADMTLFALSGMANDKYPF